MPIDPSIAMGVKPIQVPNWADTMKPYMDMAATQQQILASQQATANMQAAQPGIEADSREKARIHARNQLAQDLAKKTTITNPDGTTQLDTEAYKRELAKNGLVDEAFTISGTQLTQQAQQIQNDYNNGMNPILVAEGKKKLQDSTMIEAANTLSQIKDKDERKAYAQKYLPMAIKQYNLNPDDPRIMSLMKGDTDGVMAIANTATPQERAQLGLQQSAQQFNFETAAYTPEGRDPNSPKSQRAREIAKAAGLKVSDNMSLFEMSQIPGFTAAMQNAQVGQQVPASTRASAVQQTSELDAAIKNYDSAIAAARSARSKFGNNKIGQLAQRLGTKFLGSTEYQAMMTAVQEHNARFPGDQITDVNNFTPEQIEAKVKSGQNQLKAQRGGAAKVAESQMFPAPGAREQPSGVVKYRNLKTGDIINVPADRVKQADSIKDLKRL